MSQWEAHKEGLTAAALSTFVIPSNGTFPSTLNILQFPEFFGGSNENALQERSKLERSSIWKLCFVFYIPLLVDGCIHRAAGPLLKEECRTLSGCETGKAKISCGYRLPAKFVIHTVGPIAQGQPSAAQATELSDCYKNSLKLAVENKLRTVAFPCISTGVFGYPNDAAAEVVLNTLRKWLEENKEKVDRLIICIFLEKDDEIYKELLPRFFPVGELAAAAGGLFRKGGCFR
uniref:Mono-ADP ribosylhydrolase 1 n=1 Tax=Podarcis muralis TaxID=64176 RepID=A0A670JX09_PODMU